MASISGLSTLKAAGAGALFVVIAFKQWVFTLSAISAIELGGLDRAASISAYLIYLLATQLLVLPPILASAVAPRQSAKPLRAVQNWLERYNRPIVIGVSLIFGVWFTYKGITGLMG